MFRLLGGRRTGGFFVLFCFVLLASGWVFFIRNLFSSVPGKQQYFVCHIKGAAVFQGIPFNFLAEVLASLYQKTPHPLTDSL